jgi:GNAT superfamily N-acetyltransferase
MALLLDACRDWRRSRPNRYRVVVGEHGDRDSIVDFYAVPGHQDRRIRLQSLYISRRHRRAGLGSHVMRCILAVADAHGWAIELEPRTYSACPGAPTEKLRAWYSSFGFRPMRRKKGFMQRRPACRT